MGKREASSLVAAGITRENSPVSTREGILSRRPGVTSVSSRLGLLPGGTLAPQVHRRQQMIDRVDNEQRSGHRSAPLRVISGLLHEGRTSGRLHGGHGKALAQVGQGRGAKGPHLPGTPSPKGPGQQLRREGLRQNLRPGKDLPVLQGVVGVALDKQPFPGQGGLLPAAGTGPAAGLLPACPGWKIAGSAK